MKNFFRSIQTFFPSLHDIRFSLKFFKMKLTNSPHESDFKALRLFNLSENQEIVDVGSNRGEAIASILLANNLTNKIIGFEPNGLVFEKLDAKFKGNKRVKLHNLGLGEKQEERKLFVPFYRKWMFDGLSSFHYDDAANWLKKRLWNYKEQNLTIKEIPCHIKSMDSLNLKPAFIKIDVQGFELEVLKGAQETLEQFKPILLIESVTDEIIALLKPFGYECYSFNNGKLTPGKGKLNTFCMVEANNKID